MCNGDSLPHLSTYCPVNVCEDVGSVGVGGAVPGVEFDFEVDPEGVAGKPACLGGTADSLQLLGTPWQLGCLGEVCLHGQPCSLEPCTTLHHLSFLICKVGLKIIPYLQGQHEVETC